MTHSRGSILGLPILFLSIFGVAALHAQPVLEFKGIDVHSWPSVLLTYSASCQDQPIEITDRSNISVKENGIPLQIDSFACTSSGRNAISAALVFDAGGSMAGDKNAGAIAGGRAFIDMMDGINDEAAIFWFNASKWTIAQPRTVQTSLLRNAIDTLPSFGASDTHGRLIWAVTYVHFGVNPGRILVFLTDGYDDNPKLWMYPLIDAAVMFDIKIYTIGLGQAFDSTALRHLADTTGGRYYRVADPADLPKVFEAIYTDAVKPVVGCWIEYTSSCTGKARREIDLSLANICSGDATETKSFIVPDSAIIAGPRAVCRFAVETYSVPNHPGSRYLWETGTEDANGLKGGIVGRNDSSTVQIGWPSGNHCPAGYVRVHQYTDTCSLTDSIAVDFKRYAFPIITVLGPTQFCEGDSVVLDAGSWDTYRWSTGDTTRTIVVKKSGGFQVGVGWKDGCGDLSPTQEIKVNPKPATPVITRTGDVLHCSVDSVDYQWYRNGPPLSGAISRDLVVTKTGSYFVTVTDSNGCTSVSSDFSVQTLPVDVLQPDDNGIKWYPQPVRGDFTVRFGNGRSESRRITITDVLGRILYASNVDTDSQGSVLIPFEAAPPGVYVICVQNGGRRQFRPFVNAK